MGKGVVDAGAVAGKGGGCGQPLPLHGVVLLVERAKGGGGGAAAAEDEDLDSDSDVKG